MKLLAVIALCGAASSASAATDCSSFSDDKARLACFDAVAKPKAAVPAKPDKVAALVTQPMLEFRSKLDKVFLESAINIQVIVIDKQKGLTTGKLPALLLMGYINRASAYQIITKTDLVRNARDAGFRSLDIFGQIDGRWVFDLTTDGRTCSIDLCF